MKYLLLVMVILFLSCKEDKPRFINNEIKIAAKQPKEVNSKVIQKGPNAELVKQLANGILQIMGNNWFYCGTHLYGDSASETATAISYLVVSNMESVNVGINAWGILGTMFNESKFDSCALGYYPRKWSYKNNLLKKKRVYLGGTFKSIYSISHSKKDVLHVVADKTARAKFSSSGFDLGICQVLTKFYRNEKASSFLDLESGIRICILEMKTRAIRHRTKTPWLYWKGSKQAWYANKIRRAAKAMGASKKELWSI